MRIIAGGWGGGEFSGPDDAQSRLPILAAVFPFTASDPAIAAAFSRHPGAGRDPVPLLSLVIPENAEVLYNGEAGQALNNSEAGHPF
ncbi:MAG TPA: hypothetical protein VGQ93_04310 [Lysobacter sp.]|nr:hypothetical protein [Lysobacter sp.]